MFTTKSGVINHNSDVIVHHCCQSCTFPYYLFSILVSVMLNLNLYYYRLTTINFKVIAFLPGSINGSETNFCWWIFMFYDFHSIANKNCSRVMILLRPYTKWYSCDNYCSS